MSNPELTSAAIVVASTGQSVHASLADAQAPLLTPSEEESRGRQKRGKGMDCCAWPRQLLHGIGLILHIIYIVFALSIYAMLLMPGFIQMIFYYFFSRNVTRGVKYGDKPRQRLDLYAPSGGSGSGSGRGGVLAPCPVVIYLTGGAWTIGYRAWGALLARRLSEQGVLVACLDYRNYPQGDTLDMLEDVNTGIAWVLGACPGLGGDPGCVTLVGQSAGGHLAGLALIKQAQQALTGCPTLGASPAWAPSALHAFVGVSAALDLVALAEHRGGTFRGLLDRILALDASVQASATAVVAVARTSADGGTAVTLGAATATATAAAAGPAPAPSADTATGPVAPGGPTPTTASAEVTILIPGADKAGPPSTAPLPAAAWDSGAGSARGRDSADRKRAKAAKQPAYELLSPLEAARRLPPGAARLLPPVLLIHGTADKTVPAEGSARLGEALQSAGLSPSRCRVVLVPGKTHTAFLLEDPMRGGRDMLTETVMEAVEGFDAGEGEAGSGEGQGWGRKVGPQVAPSGGGGGRGGGGREDVEAGADGAEGGVGGVFGPRVPRMQKSLCPGFLCTLAGKVCPF
ncbi:hypothetical protein HYH03_007944 [Edaphochlamys debaryana]|uniref:protein-S-isoprenylcysteine alpha-carbonyl methylesterase n=1 Tax=Edaphochlamys debaryana TaxID=47281 RepID=A0A835Y3I9_9CHLO|nr:hypothetical protein HYH03_007944 [Edaphochlamys debaryana]|eukprot:KAG2494018.1 hypothetical protein HYH03_007944 [Edaphochlamys debaryana]